MANETISDRWQVKTLAQRLQVAGITSLGEAQAQYALSWYPDDLDKAYDVLLLANDSFEGILKDYVPNVQMLGAINRNMVTCYLDALLFAMFARLDSFEAMLFDSFIDEPRKRLAGVLRLWVNLLRAGELIKVEAGIGKEHGRTLLRECLDRRFSWCLSRRLRNRETPFMMCAGTSVAHQAVNLDRGCEGRPSSEAGQAARCESKVHRRLRRWRSEIVRAVDGVGKGDLNTNEQFSAGCNCYCLLPPWSSSPETATYVRTRWWF